MIPDKIYIDFIDDAICMSSMSETPNGGVEYIRKDALLEWAKNELATNSSYEQFLIERLIDKLESL